MKKLIVLITFLALTTGVFAQSSVGTGGTSGKYSYTPISLPSNLVLAGATGTNLLNGWSSVVISTNTSIVWTNSGGTGFNGTWTTNTTYTTNTSITYANFTAFNTRNTALQIEGTNLYTPTILVAVAKSVTGVNYDTNNITWLTIGNTFSTTNLAMEGFGYGRIVQITNSGLATNIWGASAAYYSIKQNAP